MAEVGLLPLARVALQVATQVLPPYRSRFSKQQFTQPPLLAVLCLMRYEDCTFREAEVRLREHHELRAALQLPDYTTLYRFLRRLEDDDVDRGLQETVRRLRRRRRRPVSAAIDGTGLSHTSVSTFVLCRDCSMWRHAVFPSGWCWQMRSLTPKPTTSTFGNAWERRASFPRGAGVSRMAPFAIRCSEPFRKNRTANAPRSKASARPSNASSLRARPDVV